MHATVITVNMIDAGTMVDTTGRDISIGAATSTGITTTIASTPECIAIIGGTQATPVIIAGTTTAAIGPITEEQWSQSNVYSDSRVRLYRPLVSPPTMKPLYCAITDGRARAFSSRCTRAGERI